MRGINPDMDIVELSHTHNKLFKKKKPCYACIRKYELEVGFLSPPEKLEPPEDNYIFS